LKKIFENIRLITAPNPSPMTQKGTNTYILGNQEGLCIIDPGPDNEQHYEQIKNIINKEKASHILVTHSHLDHSPLAIRMSRDFSIPIFAHGKLEMSRSSIMKKLLNMCMLAMLVKVLVPYVVHQNSIVLTLCNILQIWTKQNRS